MIFWEPDRNSLFMAISNELIKIIYNVSFKGKYLKDFFMYLISDKMNPKIKVFRTVLIIGTGKNGIILSHKMNGMSSIISFVSLFTKKNETKKMRVRIKYILAIMVSNLN